MDIAQLWKVIGTNTEWPVRCRVKCHRKDQNSMSCKPTLCQILN